METSATYCNDNDDLTLSSRRSFSISNASARAYQKGEKRYVTINGKEMKGTSFLSLYMMFYYRYYQGSKTVK